MPILDDLKTMLPAVETAAPVKKPATKKPVPKKPVGRSVPPKRTLEHKMQHELWGIAFSLETELHLGFQAAFDKGEIECSIWQSTDLVPKGKAYDDRTLVLKSRYFKMNVLCLETDLAPGDIKLLISDMKKVSPRVKSIAYDAKKNIFTATIDIFPTGFIPK